jgi:hypothetical protein
LHIINNLQTSYRFLGPCSWGPVTNGSLVATVKTRYVEQAS